MNHKICVSIIEKSKSSLTGKIKDVQKIADFIEIRSDFIHDMDVDFVNYIKSKVLKKSIFTCRQRCFGGKFIGSGGEYLKIIEKADKANFDYIDVDLEALEFNNFIPKNSKLIASFHDFDSTPTLIELEKIYKKMQKFSPEIFKLATFCKNEKDANILIEFLESKKNPEKFVICGMGEFGKKTRILALKKGAAFTFASLNGSTSAEGQMDFFEMKKLL
jgi:3-dehydroquinate dehydratase type I